MQAECVVLATLLVKRGWYLALAESCTGGLMAATCTSVAGSSGWFERGFVTYSNSAKSDLLGVPPSLIECHGAVSEPVVRAMAAGALTHSRAQVAIAVTGVAGPGGGSLDKPVGSVWFGFALASGVTSELQRFDGDREAVRRATVQHALGRLADMISRLPV